MTFPPGPPRRSVPQRKKGIRPAEKADTCYSVHPARRPAGLVGRENVLPLARPGEVGFVQEYGSGKSGLQRESR